jgi:hypothetical protein
MDRRNFLRTGAALSAVGWSGWSWAHHGWSSFDQDRPIYLEGRAVEVRWRNPHAELVLEVPNDLQLPSDLARRELPRQSAPVDGTALLAKAVLPARKDPRWEIELAPLFRLNQWQMPQVPVGAQLSVLGFTFKGEQGAALLRAEYVFFDGKVYGLRSSPA